MSKASNIIAATGGMDAAEMKEYRYQSTRTNREIYAFADAYYCVAKKKPKDEDGFVWVQDEDQHFAKQAGTILWKSVSNEHDE